GPPVIAVLIAALVILEQDPAGARRVGLALVDVAGVGAVDLGVAEPRLCVLDAGARVRQLELQLDGAALLENRGRAARVHRRQELYRVLLRQLHRQGMRPTAADVYRTQQDPHAILPQDLDRGGAEGVDRVTAPKVSGNSSSRRSIVPPRP